MIYLLCAPIWPCVVFFCSMNFIFVFSLYHCWKDDKSACCLPGFYFFGKSKIVFESILGIRHSGTTIGIDLNPAVVTFSLGMWLRQSIIFINVNCNELDAWRYRYSINKNFVLLFPEQIPLPPHVLTVLHVVSLYLELISIEYCSIYCWMWCGFYPYWIKSTR